MQADQRLSVWSRAFDHRMDQFTMASTAVVLYDRSVTSSDFNGLFEILECERHGVFESSIRLDWPFGQTLGQVAVHARCCMTVAAFHPRVIVFIHDVAVHAGLGIGREVGQSLRVQKGISADASRDAQSTDEQKEWRRIPHSGRLP